MNGRQRGFQQYHAAAEWTVQRFEEFGIAVFPARARRKGSHVTGWPDMPAAVAISKTRAALADKKSNLAGRTGDGWAVIDLDASGGVDPEAMLAQLLELLGAAVVAVVKTKRGFHIWIGVNEPVGNGFCAYIGGEIFSEPHLAMLPPSVHPEGHVYAWAIEPRRAQTTADLRALGLVPDKASHQRGTGTTGERTSAGRPAPAPPDVQEDFSRLMASAGVTRPGTRVQSLTHCPWHDDREPSLSVNWDAALFYCFSTTCGVRGGIKDLRRLLGEDTPSYRQGNEHTEDHATDGEDHLHGDNWGCDEDAEWLAKGLEEIGLSERARRVRECRKQFRVGKCGSCARTPAFPISCSEPLCLRCMPGRLAADWARNESCLPASLNLLRLVPRNLVGDSVGVLKTVRSRFREWRPRAGIEAGVYGARVARAAGAVILLAVPAELALPESSGAFEVVVVARNQSQRECIRWLQQEYVQEAREWETAEELATLLAAIKSRRRFQGFGATYGKAEPITADAPAEGGSERERKPLGRISGGSLKGKRTREELSCPFCGGAVELYPFTVPADQVERVGTHWLWKGAARDERGRDLAA